MSPQQAENVIDFESLFFYFSIAAFLKSDPNIFNCLCKQWLIMYKIIAETKITNKITAVSITGFVNRPIKDKQPLIKII